ncbi:MAG TPA: hypothetical protein VGH50_03820 [Candidatus Binatia bacterium]
MSLLLPFFLSACCPGHRICERGEPVPNLFVYSRDDVAGLLKKNGYNTNSLSKMGRNSHGTALYFDFNDRREIVVVDAKGIQERIKKPARGAFMNDERQFVAWTEDVKKGIRFRDGSTLEPPKFAPFGVDHGGEYYFFESAPQRTQISSTKNPRVPLAFANMTARSIFVKDGKIYLFGSSTRNFRSPGDYEVYEVVGQVFNAIGPKLSFEREIHIPRPGSAGASPFAVVDVDPHSDQILLIDVFDDPFVSKWYLYHLNTGKMTSLGSDKGYAFFLREDILAGK